MNGDVGELARRIVEPLKRYARENRDESYDLGVGFRHNNLPAVTLTL